MTSANEAFEAFYAEQFESVFRGLAVAFRDPQLAEEAAQEAFGRASTRWTRVQAMQRPVGWAYVVAVRFARRRRRDLFRDTNGSGAPPIVTDEVLNETLRAAIDALPPRQRVALVLRHHADLPLDEIARAMGCAVGTVQATLNAAHTRLHIDLGDDEIPEVELDAP